MLLQKCLCRNDLQGFCEICTDFVWEVMAPMLRFALVDDNAGDLARGKALLEAYLSQRPGLAGGLTAFSSPGELLAAAQQKRFQIYLLDVVMPDENGIQLGLKLREVDPQGVFIYLTSSPDFALDSYSTRAFHYLLKPVEQERLFQVLDEAVELLAGRREESVVVRCKDGLRRLNVARVVYVELFDKRLCCHMADGETVRSVSLRQSFRDAASGFLAHPAFALCGVSYAVNLSYVTRVERESVHLREAQGVPLSRAYREEFIGRWLDHHLGGEA